MPLGAQLADEPWDRWGVEETERHGSVPLVHGMVQAMGLHQAFQIAFARLPGKGDAPMDENVVQQAVKETIADHSEADPPKGGRKAAKDEKAYADQREHRRVKVIALDSPEMALMMRLMPGPSPLVHHMTVHERRHQLHRNESGAGDEAGERPSWPHGAWIARAALIS